MLLPRWSFQMVHGTRLGRRHICVKIALVADSEELVLMGVEPRLLQGKKLSRFNSSVRAELPGFGSSGGIKVAGP